MANDPRPVELWLERVHMRSVGPPKARFDPLDLRFDAPGGIPERVLLSLTNGGGKTTWIRLLSSLLVPNARQQVGRANIAEYVRDHDTSHIVTEWGMTSGDRLLLGAVYEWPNRTQPTGAPIGQLRRHWYLFRSSHVTIDDLPFVTVDGEGQRRRRSLADFSAQLHQLDPGRLVYAQNQAEWADALAASTPIDTELFRYQMRMNDSEAGAGKFIEEFNSADKLVKFFVEVLSDDADLEAFETMLTKYASIARERATYEAERDFFGAIGAAIGEFADRHDDLTAARRILALREQESARLRAAIVARIADDTDLADELTVSRTAEETERVRLATEVRVREFRSLELRYRDAQLVEAAARTALAAAQTDAAKAQLDRDAWEAVPTVHAEQSAAGRFTAADSAFQAAEGKLAPVVEQHQLAAASLAAKLRDLAAASIAEASKADEETRDAEQAVADAQTAISDATVKLTGARRDVSDATNKVERLSAVAERLRRDNHIKEGEGPAAAASRHGAHLDTLTGRITEAMAAVTKAEDGVRLANDHSSASAATLVQRRADLAAATGRRDEFERALERAGSDPGVVELTDDRLSGIAEAARLVPFAAENATERELGAAAARREIAELEALVVQVTAGGLAPTAADIETVRAALEAANVAVTTGFAWIAENVPADERERFVAKNPDLANAVVVISDPDHPRGAAGVVADAGVELRSAVLLVTPHQMAYPTTGASDATVGLPYPAAYDQAAAVASVEHAKRRRDDLVVQADDLAASAGRLRDAVATLNGFVAEWSAHPPEVLGAAIADAGGLVDEATAARSTAEEAVNKAAATERSAREEVRALESSRHAATVSRTACEGALDVEAAANDASAQLPQLQRAAVAAQGQLDGAKHLLAWHSALQVGSVQHAEQARAAAAAYNIEQERVGIPPADDAPAAPLTELRSLFKGLASEVAKRRTASGHEAEREAAQSDLATARAALDQLTQPVRELAVALAATAEAGDRTALTGRQAAARSAWESALEHKVRASTAVTAAADKVAELEPQDRQRHAVLPGDWDASTRDGVELLMGMNEAELVGLRTHANRRAVKVAELDGRIAELSTGVDQLTRFALPALDVAVADESGSTAFAGTIEEAVAAANGSQTALRSAEIVTSDADRLRMDALYVVRNVAGDGRWDGVTSPLRASCQQIGADALAVDARVNVTRAAARVRAATDTLGELDTHRELLVAQLTDLCESQRRMLRNVEKTSQLPAALGGELAGQPVFKIRFEALPAQEISVALRGRVDAWAVELGTGVRVDRERRMAWLTDALQATVKPNATRSSWHVQVIKPVTDGGHPDWHPAERISKEYSGGQELTLAVLLYCTLAAVRGANRQSGRRPPGVLILDNPFGAASNPQLLRTQHELARGLGIQLVCATGLDDPNVLTSFNGEHGVVVRMRGDTARGERFKYLHVIDPTAARVVAALAVPEAEFDGTVSATTYTIRAGSP